MVISIYQFLIIFKIVKEPFKRKGWLIIKTLCSVLLETKVVYIKNCSSIERLLLEGKNASKTNLCLTVKKTP